MTTVQPRTDPSKLLREGGTGASARADEDVAASQAEDTRAGGAAEDPSCCVVRAEVEALSQARVEEEVRTYVFSNSKLERVFFSLLLFSNCFRTVA